jgi:hypothetical protein
VPAVASSARTASAKAEPTAQAPTGFAEVFVGAWLRSSTESETAQSAVAQSMAPDVALPEPAASAQPVRLEQVSAVRSARQAPGRWQITVAVTFTEGRVRYFVVPVTADKGEDELAVAAAPAEVAPLPVTTSKGPAYSVSVPVDGPLSSTLQEFFSAYLCGVGEASRYLSPGVRLAAVADTGYRKVTVQETASDSASAAEARVPRDGTSVGIQVEIGAESADGRWPLAYELRMTARAGRWEVASLESGDGQAVRS